MAGRGCTITVQLTRTTAEEGVEELTLPVALHSPLHVLKEQLEELSEISAASQVLILCDLSDPDRNNDILLTGRDYHTLFDIGIRDGSYLTLHRLGSVRRSEVFDVEDAPKEADSAGEETQIVSTQITAAMADHSYNGILFDMEARSPFEVDVTSIFVGGMLGRVRVFAREGPLETSESNSGRWWAHQGSVSRDGWQVVADAFCRPAWDRPTEVRFDVPVRLLPGTRRAFYLHSGLPDDLGIQYQSYGEDDVVAENEHVVIWPGLGHTGSEPFDEVHGWYRAYRGLAGSVGYRCRRKGWTIWEHTIFPAELKDGVRTMLLARRRAELAYGDIRNPSHLAATFCNGSARRLHVGESSSGRQLLWPVPVVTVDETSTELPHRLISLPLHVLYHALEFMDWNWFAETARNASRQTFEDDNTAYLVPRHGSGRLFRSDSGGRRLGGERDSSSLASILGRIYMEQLFGQGSDEEDEGTGIMAGGMGRGVSGGALAALSAMLGGGSFRVRARESGSVEVVIDSEDEDQLEEDDSEAGGYDHLDADYDDEEEADEDESKDDHPSFTRQYDHNYAVSAQRLSRTRMNAAQRGGHGLEGEHSDEEDSDDAGDIGYAALDRDSRYQPRRGPDI